MKEDFHYAITLAQLLYEVEGDTEDLEEIGLVAYRFIGNKQTELARAILPIDCKLQRAELPCDCDMIEVATYIGPEDWQYSSDIYNFGDINSSYVEDYIEGQKSFLDPIYQRGKLVKYRQEGNYIYVNKGFGHIALLYHKLLNDENGLPYINDKEAIAIAEYIAYTQKYKEAIKTHNKDLFTMAKDLKSQWLIHCDAARVPEHVSQNDMDKILDTKASWNRKKKGYSFKPTL